MEIERVIEGFAVESKRIFRDDLLQRLKPRSASSPTVGRYRCRWATPSASSSPCGDEESARRLVCEEIRGFIRGRITLADEVIVSSAVERISDGDLILTYASSHVVEQVLVKAHRQGKRFTVVVVEPWIAGRSTRASACSPL